MSADVTSPKSKLHKLTLLTFCRAHFMGDTLPYVVLNRCLYNLRVAHQTLLGAERHRYCACQPLLFILLLWDTDVT